MRLDEALGLLRVLREELERPDVRLDPSQAAKLRDGLRTAAQRGIPGSLRDDFRSALAALQAKLEVVLQRVDLNAQTWGTLRDLKVAVDRVIAAQDFARRLQELRTQRGLTLGELARRSGVSLPSLRRLEAGGYAPPRLETLHRLAQALGVMEADLVGPKRVRPEPTLEQAVEREMVLDRLLRTFPDLTLSELLLADELVDAVRRLRRRHLVLLAVEEDDLAQALQALAERLRQDVSSSRALRLRLVRWLTRASEPELRALQEWVAERRPEAEASPGGGGEPLRPGPRN